MTKFLHQDLASGRWQTLSLTEQLANVGSEFERAWSWRGKGKGELAESAFDRMSELLYLTIENNRQQGPALRELTRLREELNNEWLSGRKDVPKDLSKYFLNFAVWAQASRLS